MKRILETFAALLEPLLIVSALALWSVLPEGKVKNGYGRFLYYADRAWTKRFDPFGEGQA